MFKLPQINGRSTYRASDSFGGKQFNFQKSPELCLCSKQQHWLNFGLDCDLTYISRNKTDIIIMIRRRNRRSIPKCLNKTGHRFNNNNRIKPATKRQIIIQFKQDFLNYNTIKQWIQQNKSDAVDVDASQRAEPLCTFQKVYIVIKSLWPINTHLIW